MSDDTRAKRMAVRFTDDDLAFLAEHADDEGVEPATLVRMIISRLRKGRAPLMSMMEGPQTAPLRRHSVAHTQGYAPSEPAVSYAEGQDGVAEDVLASRLAELDGSGVVALHQPESDDGAAIPIRRVARQQYNPGRN